MTALILSEEKYVYNVIKTDLLLDFLTNIPLQYKITLKFNMPKQFEILLYVEIYILQSEIDFEINLP